MSLRKHRSLSAAMLPLLAAAALTLSACAETEDSGEADSSSTTDSDGDGGTDSSGDGGDSGDAEDAVADDSGDSSDAGAAVALPDPGDGLAPAVVSEIDGASVVLYSGTADVQSYLSVLEGDGFAVEPAQQDGETIDNMYTAEKDGLSLTAEGATRPAGGPGLVVVRVTGGSATMPEAESSDPDGLTDRLPENDNATLLGATEVDGPVAYYTTNTFDDYLVTLQGEGYTVEPAQQDGEIFPDVYTADDNGDSVLSLERMDTWSAGTIMVAWSV